MIPYPIFLNSLLASIKTLQLQTFINQGTTGMSSTSSNRSPKRCWCCRRRCCRLSLWPTTIWLAVGPCWTQPVEDWLFPTVCWTWKCDTFVWGASWGHHGYESENGVCQWFVVNICEYVVDKIRCKFSLSSHKINNLGDIFDQLPLLLVHLRPVFISVFNSFPTPAYVHLLM